MYARIVATAKAYPVFVPPEVGRSIAVEFKLGRVDIYHDPLAAFVYAREGRYAQEFVVRTGLENREYTLADGTSEALVMRNGKAAIALQKSHNGPGFIGMVVGDISTMISDKKDEQTFDLVADLFAA